MKLLLVEPKPLPGNKLRESSLRARYHRAFILRLHSLPAAERFNLADNPVAQEECLKWRGLMRGRIPQMLAKQADSDPRLQCVFPRENEGFRSPRPHLPPVRQ